MAKNKYWVGTKVILGAIFKDEADVATTVDTAVLHVKNPYGRKEILTPIMSLDSLGLPITGKYEYLYEIKFVGEYGYWFIATKGVNKIVEKKTFISLSVE